MSDHKIKNLADPTLDTDAANKRWVESVLPDETWHEIAEVRGSPSNYSKEIDDSMVQSVTYRSVGNDIQLSFALENDLRDGVYAYNFEINRGGDIGGCDLLFYGECGGSGFTSKSLHRFWGRTHNQNGKDFSNNLETIHGGRFMRLLGAEVNIIGQFELRSNHVYNHGKPYSLTISGDEGSSYEFMKQHLYLRSGYTKLIGLSLNFIIQPDNNKTSTILDSSVFKL